SDARSDALFSAGAVLKQISYLALAAGLVQGLFRRRLHEPEGGARTVRELFDAVPVGLYRTTPGGRILEANRELADLLG
ncbi:MAG: hypothetical protein GWN99_09460, partial [Gemmatimonadetes bacterium]|nr:hypothetical protein [Gemmatimonadota bacterium]NIS01276.1 hypothetical protein [Gemmatimonadota bacterium]NIT67402.1 hypothetical protein [Gemmatimonadota bacterium]NIV24121.1 hypothetical protein [Gemmatimonadota bacterium]NIW75475.1 hypothetical protein [Gemmatimonadota bacterium]